MSSTNLPSSMKAQVIESPNAPYKLVSLPLPQPQDPHDILLRVKAASYCHTDAVVASGALPGLPPTWPHINCHEFTGEVVIANSAAAALGFTPGARLAVAGHGFHCCGVCEECVAGPEIELGDLRGDVPGVSAYCPTSGTCGLTHPGGFAEYVVVDARQVNRIPDGLTDVEVAPLMCAGMTVFTALRKASVRPGMVVGVVGAGGGLGHLAMQFIEKIGAKPLGVESADEPLKLAREVAPEATIVDARTTEANEVCAKGESKKGVDVVLVLPESQKAFDYSMAMLRTRGTCVLVSFPIAGFHISAGDMIIRHLNILSVLGGTLSATEEMLQFAAKHGVKAKIETYPLEKLNELVAKYGQGAGGKYVVDMTV
ncbi:putative alcohol dehydrogenase protein [Favolaschia claudopus]|uniref:Alcohol dehydrogenase protein n=1 Tax=Favolaschia claudopus TaxID=2862362 RepID=A0AAW0DLY9_9AGAR